jgi:hypothetical protein
MAEVECYRNQVTLQGKASWNETPTAPIPLTLEEARRSLPAKDVWAADIIIHSDEGRAVALAIQDRTAYAVSDGSFKQRRGTSAFLLEGPDREQGRLIGLNEIRATPEDQSAYRSKLEGILGVLAVVDCLCRLHQVTSGLIHCRLNGEQVMLNASGDEPLDPQKASFDLLVDIRSKIKASPIEWQFSWVEGHQEERHGKEDFWGQLKEVCDSMAKIYWNQISLLRDIRPNHQLGNKAWSVTIQDKKLAKIPLSALL